MNWKSNCACLAPKNIEPSVGTRLNLDRFRRIAAVAAGWARALRNWYLEAGYTQEEIRGINLLKQWLSPEQLAQYESHRYFDVVGRQSGKHYRIRYGYRDEYTRDGLAREGSSRLVFCSSRDVSCR